MNQAELESLARSAALANGLDGALVCAVIEQESGWDTWAIRYEPGFYEHYVKDLPNLTPTEAHARSMSWGLMQVMGQTAREAGFDGKFLSAICEPATGLYVGCKVLRSKIGHSQTVKEGLLRWNGGSNPNYPAQVLARKGKYEETTDTHGDVQEAVNDEN